MSNPREIVGGRREATKQHNRQTILAAARKVFAELGYGAATVRDIIRATPLASGTFYNYFQSKEEVYQAIRDETALSIRPRLSDERQRAATMEEFVSGTFRAFFEFVAQRRAEFRDLRHDPGGVSFRLDTPEVLAGFEELRADLQAAIAKGLFPAVNADLLTSSIVGVAFELCEYMLARESEPQVVADFATALFLGGIKALPKAG